MLKNKNNDNFEKNCFSSRVSNHNICPEQKHNITRKNITLHYDLSKSKIDKNFKMYMHTGLYNVSIEFN